MRLARTIEMQMQMAMAIAMATERGVLASPASSSSSPLSMFLEIKRVKDGAGDGATGTATDIHRADRCDRPCILDAQVRHARSKPGPSN